MEPCASSAWWLTRRGALADREPLLSSPHDLHERSFLWRLGCSMQPTGRERGSDIVAASDDFTRPEVGIGRSWPESAYLLLSEVLSEADIDIGAAVDPSGPKRPFAAGRPPGRLTQNDPQLLPSLPESPHCGMKSARQWALRHFWWSVPSARMDP